MEVASGMIRYVQRIAVWFRQTSPRRRLLIRLGFLAVLMGGALGLIGFFQQYSRRSTTAPDTQQASAGSVEESSAKDSEVAPVVARAPQPIPGTTNSVSGSHGGASPPSGEAVDHAMSGVSAGMQDQDEAPLVPPPLPSNSRWSEVAPVATLTDDASNNSPADANGTSSTQPSLGPPVPPALAPSLGPRASMAEIESPGDQGNANQADPPPSDRSAPAVAASQGQESFDANARNSIKTDGASSSAIQRPSMNDGQALVANPARTASTSSSEVGLRVGGWPNGTTPNGSTGEGLPSSAGTRSPALAPAQLSSHESPAVPTGSNAVPTGTSQTVMGTQLVLDDARTPPDLVPSAGSPMSRGTGTALLQPPQGAQEADITAPGQLIAIPPAALAGSNGDVAALESGATPPQNRSTAHDQNRPHTGSGAEETTSRMQAHLQDRPDAAMNRSLDVGQLDQPISGETAYGSASDRQAVGNPGSAAGLRQPRAATDNHSSVAPVPGPPDMQGVVTPALVIEKIAPQEVLVGREATFSLRVKNVGQVPAQQVHIIDAVPRGARLVSTTPQAEVDGAVLSWRIAALAPGDEVLVSYVVVPEAEGELGSVAQVTFAAQASARTLSTRPVINLQVASPGQVLLGQTVRLAMTIRNDGSGAANNLFLDEDVPEQLSHPAGRELQTFLGTLQPGQVRQLELNLVADKPGRAVNRVRVRDDRGQYAVQESVIDVLAPALRLSVQGPGLRFLDRQAVYDVTIENTGTAAANNIDIVAFLPRGLKFVSADKLGRYSPQRHAVVWNLQELPTGQAGTVRLTTIAVEEGSHRLQVEARGDLNATATTEHNLRVEGAAELHFSFSDQVDPVEVGAETVYQIELVNRGTRPDSNIAVTVELPDELEPTSSEGPLAASRSGGRIVYPPLPRLDPGQRVVLRVRAVARKAGSVLVRAQVRSDQLPTPVTKEENTRVYAD